MFNADTELFFPIRVIPNLTGLRGKEWEELIQHLSSDEVTEAEQIAFTDLVVHLAGCAGCDADSFRAMRGCTQCARLVIRRFKGTDQDLLDQYHTCQAEVNDFLQKRAG
jgi:hypothetical protein